jgi:Tfp pilus assembly protein PilZ
MQHHEIGTHVNLYLHMPDLKKPLKITGEVIHTRFFDAKDEDTGVGIKFINIDETSRQSLIDFMKNQEDCY